MSKLLAYAGNPVTIARARGVLADRDRELEALVAHARERLAASELESAAAWAQIAAYVGWARPSTQLTSPELEELLVAIGRQCVAMPAARTPAAEPQRVLHVMTRCYDTGGHTRVMERWVTRDRRESTLVLTDHPGPLPPQTFERLRLRGATIVPRLQAGNLIGRARELRALAAEHDLVVLHAHMHDVVPVLAFAEPAGRPPVVLFDHAAHQFWIGTATADVVAGMREVEDRVVTERRGIPSERIARLPIPFEPRELPNRAKSRARLELPADREVILAVASAWKVRPVLEPSFAELCDAVLTANPRATLFVIGPLADEQWMPVVHRHGDRILIPGPITDIAPLLVAADVYLDTWPASGGTTIVDVAAAGLPIVSYNDGSDDLGMVRVVTTLGDGVVSADTPAGVATAVGALLGDPRRRKAMGLALRATIDQHHGSGWNDHLEALVATAITNAGAAATTAPERLAAADWQCMMELMQAQTLPSVGAIVQANAHLLPPAERAAGRSGYEHLARWLLSRNGADATRSRAVAQPSVTAEAIGATVARFRELVAQGRIDTCAVILSEADLDRGLRLLQTALDSGDDLDIEILPGALLAAVCRDGDVVVDVDGGTQGLTSVSS